MEGDAQRSRDLLVAHPFSEQIERLPFPWGERALELLVQRHEALWTTFGEDSHGDPKQRVWAAAPVRIQHFDPESWATADDFFLHLDKTPFRISEEWPLRVGRAGDRLNLVIAHIAIDAWGARVLGREFDSALTAFALGAEPELLPAGAQPLDQALWERSPAGRRNDDSACAYWRTELESRPAEYFPAARRPETVRYHEASLTSPAADLALRLTAATLAVPMSAVALAVGALVLAHMTGRDAVPFHMTWAARQRADAKEIVGSLFRDIVFTLDASGAPALSDLAVQAQRHVLRSGMRGQFDLLRFHETKAAASRSRGLLLRPGVSFNFRPFEDTDDSPGVPPADESSWAELRIRSTWAMVPATREHWNAHDLHIRVSPAVDGLRLVAVSHEEALDEEALRRFLYGMEAVLVRAAATGDTTTDLDHVLGCVADRPDTAYTQVGASWLDLRETERLLRLHPAVHDVELSLEDSTLRARVTTQDDDLTPAALRQTLLAGIDACHMAACPALFEIRRMGDGGGRAVTDEVVPRIVTGPGTERNHSGPADEAERVLHRAVMAANGLASVSMTDNYTEASGRWSRIPNVCDLVARAGYSGLSLADFEGPRCLADVAAGMQRADDSAGPTK
ncbi:condensation domain-containing protein [Streptomyces sp. NPDC085479]|uniref:condensation domain-containing protein n=1 Tax=Streptomyces sp. NPDC085479 TaxID=3365726 RepID=UPI0037D05428